MKLKKALHTINQWGATSGNVSKEKLSQNKSKRNGNYAFELGYT